MLCAVQPRYIFPAAALPARPSATLTGSSAMRNEGDSSPSSLVQGKYRVQGLGFRVEWLVRMITGAE